MPKLPRPSGKDLLAFLLSRGFTLARVRGSHHVLVKDNLRTVVPVHGNSALKIGTLHGILRDIELPAEAFIEDWDNN